LVYDDRLKCVVEPFPEVLDPRGGGEWGGGGVHLLLQGGASDDFKVERNRPPPSMKYETQLGVDRPGCVP